MQPKCLRIMVGPNGLEPSTSSVSRKRSNQTELRAYTGTTVASILRGTGDSGKRCTKSLPGRSERGLQGSPFEGARDSGQGACTASGQAASAVANRPSAIDNASVSRSAQPAAGEPIFHAGAMVIVSLANPREKFWGALAVLEPAGLTLCGIDLASFDDSAALVKSGDAFTPSTVFLPMHRVERMELDAPAGDIPPLSERFAAKSGRDPAQLFAAAVRERDR
jgi:hypothetical protein